MEEVLLTIPKLFCRSLLFFFFWPPVVLSVLFRYMTSDYLFNIFNLFLIHILPGYDDNYEIIHGRHRVVQIYTWAGPLYSNFTPSDSER